MIGGGPAGSAAAAAAAAAGLKTLVMEKEAFPRDKVCSGMIVSRLAGAAAARLFTGWPPEDIYSHSLRGIALHVGSAPALLLEWPMRAYWRRDLDRWMLDRAARAGAEVLLKTEYEDLAGGEDGYTLFCQSGAGRREVAASRVVGADGAGSPVRKKIYPDLKPFYAFGCQQVMEGTANLDPDYIHMFTASSIAPYYTSAHFKQGFLVYEAGAPSGGIAGIRRWGLDLLESRYGLKATRLVSSRGCREPLLYHAWFSGTPLQGRGGVLLAGDAAGLVVPGSGEGIGLALYSGAAAAAAAAGPAPDCSGTYLERLKEKMIFIRQAYQGVREFKGASAGGDQQLLESWGKLWRGTLEGEFYDGP